MRQDSTRVFRVGVGSLEILVEATPLAVYGLYLPFLQSGERPILTPVEVGPPGSGAQDFENLLTALAGFLRNTLEGEEPSNVPPFRLAGLTEFRRQVLEVTGRVERGATRSYSWVARELGRPGSARAVGSALSRNPLPILIPCHRIVRSDGEPGGYSSGPGWKEILLGLESDGEDY